MRSTLRRGAFVLAMGCVIVGARADAQTPSDDITGSLGLSAPALRLNDEQRHRIYEGVMRMPDALVAKVPAQEADAAMVPISVPLQDLPPSVIREIPLMQGHKFVKLDDRILVVDPSNRRVVAMIPRYKVMLQ